MDLDADARPIHIWWPKLTKCGAKRPNNHLVTCDLQQGHGGEHIDYDYAGKPRNIWPLIASEPKVVVNIDLNEQKQWEWAASLNPNKFKSWTGDKLATSESCDRADHKGCTEPWCECDCHDGEDLAQAVLRLTGRCGECYHTNDNLPYHNHGCSKDPNQSHQVLHKEK